ncbi:uracil-DNA glycosylase-like isoform X1 [Lytechinus pictus]|uniref:uracil-DNA glycosylase-like isoform X1 n=2 Tax=Lytechinus pictus TaxID=7653 RepID=UPI0030BA0AD9
MIGQSKISAFFSPKQVKRPLSSVENTQSPSPKKAKDANNGKPSGLSPEQKQRMEEKKKEALEKLKMKKTEISPINGVKNGPEGIGASWAKALSSEFSKPYFIKLQEFVAAERRSHTIYPPAHQVFSWTQTCNIKDVKVVILGQDPYHGPGQAHGLCFSVQKGVKPPPSLENMYKCLKKDIDGFEHPGHGHLIGWSKQGVLLLNAVLTVRANNPNSHKDKGWEKFTTAVIAWLNSNLNGVVFMLWGSYAQKKGSIINSKRHHVLKAVHPSPLSAHRGFFDCQHFSRTNELLKEAGKKPIDWSRLSDKNV